MAAPKGGRTNALSGHCARIAHFGGLASGKQARSEAQVKSALKSGQLVGHRHAKNHTGVCGRTPEKMAADGKKAGHIGGTRVKETKRGIFAPEFDRRKAGRINACWRWNISRGKTCICGYTCEANHWNHVVLERQIQRFARGVPPHLDQTHGARFVVYVFCGARGGDFRARRNPVRRSRR